MCSIPFLSYRGMPFASFGSCNRPRRQCGKVGPPAWRRGNRGLSHRRGPYSQGPSFGAILGFLNTLDGDRDQPQIHPWRERVNCHPYTDNEINVGLRIADDKLIVEGLQEMKFGSGGSEVRRMKREIPIPQDVDTDSIKSFLNRKGVLIITGSRKSLKENRSQEREKSSNSAELKICRRHKNSLNRKERTDDIGMKTDEQESREDKVNVTTPLSEAHDEDGDDCVIISEQEMMNTSSSESLGGSKEDTADAIKVAGEGGEEFLLVPIGKLVDFVDNESVSTSEKRDIPSEVEMRDDEDVIQDQTSATDDGQVITKDTDTNREVALEAISQKEFRIEVDMKNMNPESIVVKLAEESLLVTGKQEDTELSTGKILATRTLWRKFPVPSDVNSDLLTSELTASGQLVLRAPYKTNQTGARKIPITIG